MITKIYEDYSDFHRRENKKENGVSKEFAELHPNYEVDNSTNEGCWNCRYCSYCSDCYSCSYCRDCSDCYSCSYCSYCSDCSDCRDCRDCRDCSLCSDCRDCRDCSFCSYCSSKDKVKENLESSIPMLENIHQKVLEAVSITKALDMGNWHTCETTHCRAGWVVHLAGKEGYELENETSTLFAAMQIYKKSSRIKVSPTRFFETNEVAMADIKRCAKLEINQRGRK